VCHIPSSYEVEDSVGVAEIASTVTLWAEAIEVNKEDREVEKLAEELLVIDDGDIVTDDVLLEVLEVDDPGYEVLLEVDDELEMDVDELCGTVTGT